jgi:Cu/Ag efflux protein CusF
MKKSISVVASAVLTGVLMLSGCGGSSSSGDGGGVSSENALPSLGKDDNTARGSAKIVADASGNTNVTISLISDSGKKQVSTATITRVADANGNAVCTNASDNCEVKAFQLSACGIDSSNAAFIAAKVNVVELITGSDRWDANTDMVVFGGTMDFTAKGFNKCTMALAINMIPCGSAFKTDGTAVQAGFSNENHIVDVFVEEADGTTKWVRDVKVKDGKILIPAGELSNVDLPAKFTFYSIKDSNKDNTTGVTGGTGGSGY